MKKDINTELLIKKYLDNAPLTEICKEFGVSKRSVYLILKSQNIELRRTKLHDGGICPFYKLDVYNQIYCDCDNDLAFLTLAFSGKEQKNIHKKSFCSKKYEDCSIYKAIMEKVDN